jgi:acetyl-CoA C-acetyltransferase
MSADPTVIVGGARTGMGRLLGSLKDFSATDLGGFAIRGALEKSGVSPEQVDYVIMGQVLQAGAGQMPARQSAVNAGIPMSVPSITINKVCLSGLDAIALADQLIRVGEVEIVVAGGQESMTNAPHLLLKAREGYKYGDVTMRDHMAYDGLWDVFTDQAMGALTDQANTGEYAFSREDQDTFAARSHELAAKAWKDGVFDDEVVSVSIPQRKGDPVEYKADEGVRADTSVEALARLRPAFSKEGTITAGSASPISDGAAAVVVMRKSKAEELGLTWLAEIGAHGIVAGPDSTLQAQPANAIRQACAKEGIDPAGLDLVEINEAFASVALASTKDLGIVLHLALELKRRGGGVGAAALCGGGGQGDALVLRVPPAA